MSGIGLNSIDLTIIFLYLVGIIWYGIKKGKRESSEDYFLAGRNMIWPIVGISLFAANIGSNTLIGLASDAYQTNVAVYNYEWMAAVVLVFFAIFFLPFYLKSKVYTMPEFIERRYDSRSRYLFSAITIIGNVIIDTASGLYAGNLILKIVFPGVPSWVIISLLALAAAAYTIPGGLSSVVHTEVIQAMLLLLGSMVLTYFCFKEVGGWGGMIDGLNTMREAGSLTKTPEQILSLVKPASDPHLPWTGLLLGVPLLGFYFWANNQFMVQRVLSAKDLNHGRWGALFAGLLKLPVLFFMVLPGVVAIVLFADLDVSFLNYTINQNGQDVICASLSDCPNMTYPVLIYKLLPTGLLGLVIAGLLAAMSSSISATLNSASTLITMDFVSKINKDISNKGLVRAGQIATVILVICAAVWSPMVETVASSLWEYLQLVLGYISPPIVAVFIVGLFYRRANGNGAFYSLILGYVISITFILAKINDVAPSVTDIHFLIQVPILFVICVFLNIVISHLSPAPAAEKVEKMTWNKTLFKEETKELQGIPWYQNYRILAIILLLITAFIVGWFW